MSKSIIRSAKPYWIYLILTGKKTVEVGKDFPKSKDWNRIVEMYCSKDMRSFNRIPEKDKEWMRKYLGKVACRFVCDYIDEYKYSVANYGGLNIDCQQLDDTCLTKQQIEEYANGKAIYGWHISDLVIYDKPRELGEFNTYCRTYPVVKDCDICIDNCPKATKTSDWTCDRRKPLTRPPQSWCYVED